MQSENRMKFSDKKMLFVFIFICLSVEVMSWYFTHTSVRDWYPRLIKPSWTPPSWVFGPVWTLLYLMMATSAWLIWKEVDGSKQSLVPYLLFSLQLLLNLLWSALFFVLKSPFLALVDITALWGMILATILAFFPLSWKAALLLLPYLLWVTYALALNFSIWWLNV